MRECIDEGILQSYFDGELRREKAESVAAHLKACVSCARAARELESENLLLSKALEPEFAAPVPTERLRHRIDAAVAGLHVVRPVAARGSRAGGWLQSIADLFATSPQRAFGYAGVAAVIVFATIVGIVYLRHASVPNNGNKIESARDTRNAPTPASTASPERAPAVALTSPPPIESQAAYHPRKSFEAKAAPGIKLLPGERSYLKTIASLDTTIKSERDAPMRPALQAEYERNLALVDRAIAATRSAAKKNPNDPDAAEFMFAAYQSKVDLLNQVADARLSNRRQ